MPTNDVRTTNGNRKPSFSIGVNPINKTVTVKAGKTGVSFGEDGSVSVNTDKAGITFKKDGSVSAKVKVDLKTPFTKSVSINVGDNVIPKNKSGWYIPDIAKPIDPRDCQNYPNSPFCGGNPFSALPLGIEPSINISPGCGFNICANAVIGFVKTPSFCAGYTDPGCVPPPPPNPPRSTNFNKPLPFPDSPNLCLDRRVLVASWVALDTTSEDFGAEGLRSGDNRTTFDESITELLDIEFPYKGNVIVQRQRNSRYGGVYTSYEKPIVRYTSKHSYIFKANAGSDFFFYSFLAQCHQGLYLGAENGWDAETVDCSDPCKMYTYDIRQDKAYRNSIQFETYLSLQDFSISTLHPSILSSGGGYISLWLGSYENIYRELGNSFSESGYLNVRQHPDGGYVFGGYGQHSPKPVKVCSVLDPREFAFPNNGFDYYGQYWYGLGDYSLRKYHHKDAYAIYCDNGESPKPIRKPQDPPPKLPPPPPPEPRKPRRQKECCEMSDCGCDCYTVNSIVSAYTKQLQKNIQLLSDQLKQITDALTPIKIDNNLYDPLCENTEESNLIPYQGNSLKIISGIESKLDAISYQIGNTKIEACSKKGGSDIVLSPSYEFEEWKYEDVLIVRCYPTAKLEDKKDPNLYREFKIPNPKNNITWDEVLKLTHTKGNFASRVEWNNSKVWSGGYYITEEEGIRMCLQIISMSSATPKTYGRITIGGAKVSTGYNVEFTPICAYLVKLDSDGKIIEKVTEIKA